MAKLSTLGFVKNGFGQVEPNHLSAQRTGQIYAQLPAVSTIDVLENGQFVKYNYAEGVVDFAGAGEWMLVFNEVKTYYDYEPACNFAMKKDNYNARIYSPVDADSLKTGVARNYDDFAQKGIALDGTDEPFRVNTYTGPKAMPEGSTMVPRVFKTNVGDIMTTNTINAAADSLKAGDLLIVGKDGYLAPAEAADGMTWQVAKVYTMPDGQPGVKIIRIA